MFAQSAQAHSVHHHHYHHHHYHHHADRFMHHHMMAADAAFDEPRWADAAPSNSWNDNHSRSIRTSGLGRRPAAWCGWQMRQLVGSDPGPDYNLARNWSHWGHAGAVGVGAVVVWRHHVGKIVGREDGQWIVQSGNDGHRLRTRPRSLAGIVAIRWG
jgi:hypothetical protein